MPDLSTSSPSPPDLRAVAARLLDAVLERRRALDEALADPALGFAALADRDRAAARRLVSATLRRLGQLDDLVQAFTARPPKGLPLMALRLGLCEILFLGTPHHAAVSQAVNLLPPPERGGARARGLVNAVLRRAVREGAAHVAQQDAARMNTPAWLWRRWRMAYGEAIARAIATAHLGEAPLDITLKTPAAPADWPSRLEAARLPTGTLRRMAGGAVEQLPGFDDEGGAHWWVQDAAAALPARLLGDVRGQLLADLCAAPGGKTAQLLAAGAEVYAIDRSEPRLRRLKTNLARLGLKARVRTDDAATWQPAPGESLDGILLDAPCSATGTIRRHPDLPHLKQETDIAKLAAAQRRLLEHALDLVRPGGLVVYCVCSLEPEEGEGHLHWLRQRPDVEILPVEAAELGVPPDMIDAAGALRTLPCHWPEHGGLDGFFALRLRRKN